METFRWSLRLCIWMTKNQRPRRRDNAAQSWYHSSCCYNHWDKILRVKFCCGAMTCPLGGDHPSPIIIRRPKWTPIEIPNRLVSSLYNLDYSDMQKIARAACAAVKAGKTALTLFHMYYKKQHCYRRLVGIGMKQLSNIVHHTKLRIIMSSLAEGGDRCAQQKDYYHACVRWPGRTLLTFGRISLSAY